MQIEFSETGSSEAPRAVTVQKAVASPAVPPKHETIDPYEDPGHVVMGGAVRRYTK